MSKKTLTASLPDGWNLMKLSEIAEVQTGLALGREAKIDPVEIPYLRVANVQDGFLDLSVIKQVTVERAELDRFMLRSGDVLLTEGGDFDKLGRGYIWNCEIPNCLHQNHVFVVRPHSSRLLPYYLASLTSSDSGRKYFKNCSKQSTNLASINSSQLKAFPILLPPLPEQRAIAAVLSTWDRAIRQTADLIAAKRCFKQVLIQLLLSRTLSFGGEDPAFQQVTVGEIVEKVALAVEVDAATEYREIGIRSHGKGIFHKEPVLGAVLGDKRVFRVVPGCLTVNIVFAWEQAVAVTTTDEAEFIASHRFPMFKPDSSRAEAKYLLRYFLSQKGSEALQLASPGGAGRNCTMSQSAFLKLRLPLPSIRFQQQFVSFVDHLDLEINLLTQKLAALRTQKKGLMQKLLTGVVRVKVAP